MSNPNSPLTRFRRWLAGVIEPRPDAGDAWCMDCSLNRGRTLTVSSAAAPVHVEKHHREDPEGDLYVISHAP